MNKDNNKIQKPNILSVMILLCVTLSYTNNSKNLQKMDPEKLASVQGDLLVNDMDEPSR